MTERCGTVNTATLLPTAIEEEIMTIFEVTRAFAKPREDFNEDPLTEVFVDGCSLWLENGEHSTSYTIVRPKLGTDRRK